MRNGNLILFPKQLVQACKYSSWTIPKNKFKISEDEDENGSIRYKCNEILHPFYKPSTIEEFSLCYKQHEPSLLSGRPNFAKINKNTNDINCVPLILKNTKGLPEWIQNYTSYLNNSKFNKLTSYKEVNESDITSFNKPSYITLEKFPQMKEVIYLLQRTDTAHGQLDTLALASLIDYIIINSESGIFTEDIYSFILQNHCHSIKNLNFISDSIIIHIDSLKLDNFKVVEKLISQVLSTIKQSNIPSNSKNDSLLRDVLSRLINKTKGKFNIQNLQPVVNYQLFNQYVSAKNPLQSKKYLHQLIKYNNIVPSTEMVNSYLELLNESFPDDRISKLTYITELSNVIEHNVTSSILEFSIPLCIHFNEILRLLDIVLKSESTNVLINKGTLGMMLNQIVNFNDNAVIKSIHITSVLEIITAHKIKLTPFVELFIENFSKVGNYSMITKLIEQNSISLLKNTNLLENILINFKENERYNKDSLEFLNKNLKFQFLQKFVLPIADKVELSEPIDNYINPYNYI